MIGVPSMQISKEEMKYDPLKFVLKLFPTRFAYHYHTSHGSLVYFDQMEWFQIFTKKNWELLHHPILGKLFSLHAKTTRLMSDANFRDNHNVVKIQKWRKNKLSLFLGLFASWIGFSKYERRLKFDKRSMWGNINILSTGGDINQWLCFNWWSNVTRGLVCGRT
jgi:hypothetical protein